MSNFGFKALKMSFKEMALDKPVNGKFEKRVRIMLLNNQSIYKSEPAESLSHMQVHMCFKFGLNTSKNMTWDIQVIYDFA